MNNLMRTKRNNGLSYVTDFDRMLDSFFKDTPFWNTNAPSVDITESDDAYVLEADLPGMNDKDIDVKVENDILTISSNREEKKEENKKGYLLKERRSCSFSRSFVLPKDVDRSNIEAHFKNGVLTLNLPKSPEAKPRNIDIKVK